MTKMNTSTVAAVGEGRAMMNVQDQAQDSSSSEMAGQRTGNLSRGGRRATAALGGWHTDSLGRVRTRSHGITRIERRKEKRNETEK